MTKSMIDFDLRNAKALSTVVVALVLLVIAVLLASIVSMYATTITSTRTQEEALRISNYEIWVYGNDTAYAALTIDNIGGRDALVDKIEVRGAECEWSAVYFLRRSTAVSTSLNCPNETHSWTGFLYTTGTIGDFSTDSYDKPLASGDTLVVYIKNPDSIDVSDLADKELAISVTVFTMGTQYPIECSPKAAERAPS